MNHEFKKVIFRTIDEDRPENSALMCCIGNMQSYVAAFKAIEVLERLFDGVGIGGSDFPPWELCHWKNRSQAEDEYEQPFRDEDYPSIGQDDYLAWADPFDYGAEHHWNTYKEKDIKLVLEDAFTFWAKESPSRRKEFSEALAIYGMKLQA